MGKEPHQELEMALLDSEWEIRRIFLTKCRHVAALPEPAPFSSVPLNTPVHVLIFSLL